MRTLIATMAVFGVFAIATTLNANAEKVATTTVQCSQTTCCDAACPDCEQCNSNCGTCCADAACSK